MLCYHLIYKKNLRTLKKSIKTYSWQAAQTLHNRPVRDEMTIDTKEDAVPYAARPYKLV